MSVQKFEYRQDVTFDPMAITRPDHALMTYYIFRALATGPGLIVALPMLYFRYHTMQYRFDDRGVAMSWGILFRREIYLTYRRIQDIHLTRNIIQRWMGLATINIQTASGGAGPEMSIEGILAVEQLRDFLYVQMRGSLRDGLEDGGELLSEGLDAVGGDQAHGDRVLILLTEIRDLLHRVNEQRRESQS